MAKFKKGDRVTDGDAVYEITDVDDGIYKWRPVGGKGDPSYSEGGEVEWAERKMRLANSAPVSTNSIVRNAMAARTARNAETASQIAAKASRDAEELEAMVKKATPWRNEMRRMRSRYEQITDWWAAVPPKDDPDYGKAVAAMQRREKAIRDAGDLWFSIERS